MRILSKAKVPCALIDRLCQDKFAENEFQEPYIVLGIALASLSGNLFPNDKLALSNAQVSIGYIEASNIGEPKYHLIFNNLLWSKICSATLKLKDVNRCVPHTQARSRPHLLRPYKH